MRRPSLAPEVMAALVERAPARLVRKLDEKPEVAEGWTWRTTSDSVEVETEGGERVCVMAVDGAVRDAGALACSCLLSPRCLHVLAVARALPLGDAPSAAPSVIEAPVDDDVAVTRAQREAAGQLLHAVSELIDAGALAAGARVQAELLRAVHGARAQGLHRAASAALRAVTRIRELETEAPTFALAALTLDVEEAISIAHVLTRAERATERELGTARRRYEPIGALRVHGLCAEPIVTASGYAGVATIVMDDRGRVFTVSDVAPGDVERAKAAYAGGTRLGEVSLSPRELARTGLFLQNATASRDGRLGAGAEVKAARAPGTSWDAAPIATRFAEPLGVQLDRAYASDDALLFLDVIVNGLAREGLVITHVDGPSMLAIARPDRPELPGRDTLRLLARAPGLALRVIARPIAPLRVAALAFAPRDPASMALPSTIGDRVCVGLDPLTASALVRAEPHAVEVPLELALPDPLLAVRRRVERAVLVGRASIPPSAADEIDREAATLERGLMPTLASALRALRDEALSRPRSLTGARVRGDASRFATRWLTLATVSRAAQRVLDRRAWGA